MSRNRVDVTTQSRDRELELTKAEVQSPTRLTIAKAYKMYVGGAFIRSESGRYFQVKGHRGEFSSADPEVVNVPWGSRKDVRDAVLVAKNAEHSWASRVPFNRGQILYRLAEVMESRRDELEASLERAGSSRDDAVSETNAAIDRTVYYAGFADKVSALVSSHNPVSGPHFGFSIPEPMGTVGIVCPPRPSLLGLVSTVLPPITVGNTVVAVASAEDPRTAVVWTECLATSDLPGGVVNVLTGHAAELGPILARHREVISLDAWSNDDALRTELEKLSADNVKRVKTYAVPSTSFWTDDSGAQGLSRLERYLETKTVWHPMGL